MIRKDFPMVLDILRENFIRLLSATTTDFHRYFANRLDLSGRLTGIVGPRGVGKTTFMLQYLKESKLPIGKKLYFSADSVEISDTTLLQIAKDFETVGGEVLAIDEIHKYPNFEQELKNIYDLLDLQVIFSGSSALRLEKSEADLSRRAALYRVEGLSYREFLEMKTNRKFPVFSLEEILERHLEIALELGTNFRPLEFWNEYLQSGYYPFYFENPTLYSTLLERVVNTVIEVDLPSIFSIRYENIINLKKLIKLICQSEPHKINITELSRKIGIDRETLYRYLDYLNRGSIFTILRSKSRGDAIFSKPEKLYLHNTNLHYAYCEEPKIGTIRETFLISQLMVDHTVVYPSKGDLIVDDRWTIEIGGRKKGYRQIEGVKESFVASDNIVAGSDNKIPLWMFGFLY